MVTTFSGAVVGSGINDIISGGMFEAISVDSITQRTSGLTSRTFTEVFLIDPRADIAITMTSGTGVSIVEWGTGANTSYTPVSRVNARIFPTSAATATLFPGDKSRGSSLN